MREPPDGCRDEPDPEAEAPVQRQSDESPMAPGALDAWDASRRDGAEDEARQLLVLPDADAERWAGPAPAGRVQAV